MWVPYWKTAKKGLYDVFEAKFENFRKVSSHFFLRVCGPSLIKLVQNCWKKITRTDTRTDRRTDRACPGSTYSVLRRHNINKNTEVLIQLFFVFPLITVFLSVNYTVINETDCLNMTMHLYHVCSIFCVNSFLSFSK